LPEKGKEESRLSKFPLEERGGKEKKKKEVPRVMTTEGEEKICCFFQCHSTGNKGERKREKRKPIYGAPEGEIRSSSFLDGQKKKRERKGEKRILQSTPSLKKRGGEGQLHPQGKREKSNFNRTLEVKKKGPGQPLVLACQKGEKRRG